jgi:uncharacterized membrane protein HdeD (DUF308 family)
MLISVLFVAAGIFMIASGSGVTFLSVAFILGILFMVGGVCECLSCFKDQREDTSENRWINIDGLTTFMLGFLIISNKLAADATVPLVLGLWVAISGIRNLVRALDRWEEQDSYFYGHLSIGILNIVVGLYMYFNADLFVLPVGVLVGVCVMVQGINLFMAALTIKVPKSQFIMTKEEMLIQAMEDAENAHQAAKDAIQMAKEARETVKIIEETPAAELDAALAPKPGEEAEDVVEETSTINNGPNIEEALEKIQEAEEKLEAKLEKLEENKEKSEGNKEKSEENK